MKVLGESGYTLVEIMLFLAVAGLMLLIALLSIGTRNRDVQFTDGTRAFEVYLERAYSEVRNGSFSARYNCQYDEGAGEFILNDPAYPSNGDCIFLGYLFELGDYEATSFGDDQRSQLISHQIIGRRLTSFEKQNCTNSLIYCAQPTLSGVVSTLDIPWGVEIHGAYNNDAIFGDWSTFAFGFLRKPDTSAIVTTTVLATVGGDSTDDPNWEDPADPDALVNLFDMDDGPVARRSFVEEGNSTNLCLQSGDGGRFASITVSDEFREESIELGFEPNDSYAAGCAAGGDYR